MNRAATAVVSEIAECIIAYGFSDEYRSVIHPPSKRCRRGADTLVIALSCIRLVHYLKGARGTGSSPSKASNHSWESADDQSSKLISTIVSTFTSYFAHLWPTYFPDTPLSPPLPSFDARAVLYPTDRNLRDYLSWRQVDCMNCLFPLENAKL